MARKIKRKMAAGGNLTGNLSNQGYQNENFTKNRTYVGNKALQYLYGSWAGAADILGMGSLADSALEDQGIEMGDVYNASRGVHGATGGAVAGFFGVGEGTSAGQKGLGDLGQGNDMNGQNLGAYNTYSQNNINIPKSNTTQINNEGPFVTPELYPEKNSKQLFMFGGLRRFTGKGGGDFNDLPEPPATRAGAEGTPVRYPNNPGFNNYRKPSPDFSKFGNAPISLSQSTNFAIKKYDPVGDSTKIYDSRLTNYNNVPRLNNGVLTAPGAGINNITLMGTGTNPNVLRSTVAKEQPGGFAMGGNLTELNAPTHEEGGFTMGGHELEGTETIDTNNQYVFSDRLKVPGKKYNFSKASKIIKNKYKLRENDKMSDEAMQQELDDLMNTQEVLRQGMMEKAYMKAYGGNLYGDGGKLGKAQLEMNNNTKGWGTSQWEGSKRVKWTKELQDKYLPYISDVIDHGDLPVGTVEALKESLKNNIWPEYVWIKPDSSAAHGFNIGRLEYKEPKENLIHSNTKKNSITAFKNTDILPLKDTNNINNSNTNLSGNNVHINSLPNNEYEMWYKENNTNNKVRKILNKKQFNELNNPDSLFGKPVIYGKNGGLDFKNKFNYGGNMYAGGGPYTTPELYPTDAMGLFDPNTGQITRIPDQGIDFTTFNRPQEPLLDFTPSQGGYIPNTSQTVPELNQTWAPDRGGVNFINNNTNKPVMIPRNTNNNIPNITNTFAPVGTPNDVNESDNVNRDYNNKLSPYGYIASALTTTGKVLANQLQSKPTQLPNIYLERLSKDPAIQARIAAQNRLAVMNKALGQQADTSGQAVANIGMFNTEAANNLAQTIGQQEAGINAANVQLSNQEKQINLGQFEKNALMNEQFKDNRLNNTMTNMDSYNHLAQTMNTDSIKNKQQNQMINNWIKTKDYSILPNGKPAYMTSDEKGNIIYVDAEGVRYNIKGQVLKLNS